MNERIRELAFKAAEDSTWKPGLGNEHVQEYFQAFAELLIRECSNNQEFFRAFANRERHGS